MTEEEKNEIRKEHKLTADNFFQKKAEEKSGLKKPVKEEKPKEEAKPKEEPKSKETKESSK